MDNDPTEEEEYLSEDGEEALSGFLTLIRMANNLNRKAVNGPGKKGKTDGKKADQSGKQAGPGTSR